MKNKLKEDVAMANAGNTSGMGAVVASQPSSIPGDVSGATVGSGDIGIPLNRNIIPRKSKKEILAKLKKSLPKRSSDNIPSMKPSSNIKSFKDFIKESKSSEYDYDE